MLKQLFIINCSLLTVGPCDVSVQIPLRRLQQPHVSALYRRTVSLPAASSFIIRIRSDNCLSLIVIYYCTVAALIHRCAKTQTAVHLFYYLRQGGYILPGFVCLSVTNFTVDEEEMNKFWKASTSGSGRTEELFEGFCNIAR